MKNQNTPAPTTLRVTGYLPLDAWEALTKHCVDTGQSMSGITTALLYKFLARECGFEGAPPVTRNTRTDFKPSKTLAAALEKQEHALNERADRVRTKLEKVRKLKVR